MSGRGRRRAGLCGAVLAAGLLVAGGGPTALGQPAADGGRGAAGRPLTILISNDDGYRHPYLEALRAALVKAGHRAVVVAPAEDMSGRGTGMMFSPGATLRAEETAPDVWAVSGSPGDAVAFGLQRVFTDRPPDLVVSGVNAGPNAGPTAGHSGTVGATLAAADADVPAIAVSAGYDLSDPQHPFPSVAGAAAFTARTVERLAATARGGPLLPRGTALNINYPAHPGGKVAFTNVGRARTITANYYPDPASCATCYKVRLGLDPQAPEGVPDADTAALARNEVAVSLLTGDWGAHGFASRDRGPSREEARRTAARLYGLTP
ncbi:5'/3'-nucleotidase SurE [Streptomyces sp. NPDC101150]|uniref:5'/3'-nucleotidase SurE n=1 Tax=Streptomyces sp. NPDC101150 TaxID=3366114 RepID=UPI0038018446